MSDRLTATAGADPGSAPVVPGLRELHFAPESATAMGLQLEQLHPVVRRPEVRAYAEVLDIEPLLQVRAQFHEARAEQAIAEAALVASAREFERVRVLVRAGAATSQRQAQEAEARYGMDRARLEMVKQRLTSVRERAVQRWGSGLVDTILDGESKLLADLLARQQVLLLAVFERPLEKGLEPAQIVAGRDPHRAQAQPVHASWPAPSTIAYSQGVSYFLSVLAGELRVGMRIYVWVPRSEGAISGVEIKTSAIVWEAGQPWAYVAGRPGVFSRRLVGEHIESADGWLVTEGLRAGERIVTRGAQQLLSEEHRQPLKEDDD